jgi:hypothetical protein
MECRPGAWFGGDFVTKIPTAIGWKWIGTRGKIESALLLELPAQNMQVRDALAMMMDRFLEEMLVADVVVGHYIRGFDLPLLNNIQIRLGRSPLPDVMAQDTKLDLAKIHGISKSLENLGSLLSLSHPKVHMSAPDWERAYEGNGGLDSQRKRVEGDVRLNIVLRKKLLELGFLGAPKAWTSSSSQSSGRYQA